MGNSNIDSTILWYRSWIITILPIPSGATPSFSQGSSQVDLVSFIVKQWFEEQNFTSAGLNYVEVIINGNIKSTALLNEPSAQVIKGSLKFQNDNTIFNKNTKFCW